jgi:hypothetical protein
VLRTHRDGREGTLSSLQLDSVDFATWNGENVSGKALVFTADGIKITKTLTFISYN